MYKLKIGDRVFAGTGLLASKQQGTVVGIYNHELVQVLSDIGPADEPFLVKIKYLSIIKNPNNILKDIL